MENIIEILKYIGPFVGVYIGWILSQKSEKYKINYEEQKRIKNTLFNMLEIRNNLLQYEKIDRTLRLVISKIKAHPKYVVDDEINSTYFKNFIGKLLFNFNENYENDFGVKFNQSVVNLSEINPVLAFRINGKQNVKKFIESWETESIKILDADKVEEIEEALLYFKPRLVNEINSDLIEIINDIMDLIGDDDIKKETIEVIRNKTQQENDADLTEYIDRMFG